MTEPPLDWMNFLIGLVPFGQTLIWAVLIIGAALLLRQPLLEILRIITKRIADGDKLILPWLSLERNAELRSLKEVAPARQVVEEGYVRPEAIEAFPSFLPDNAPEWNIYRRQSYARARRLYLAHILTPSKSRGQEYDVFILVRRHKSESLEDVEKAEFFMGPSWGNTVFSETPIGNVLGLRTAAFGPFLCICKITFTNGDVTMLERYVDFEMGPAAKYVQ